MADNFNSQRPNHRISKPLPAEQPSRSSKRKQNIGLPFDTYFLRKIGDDFRFMNDEDVGAWIVSLEDVLKAWKTNVLDVPLKRAQLLQYLEYETAGGYWEMLATDVFRLCDANKDILTRDRVQMNGTEDCAFTAAQIIQDGLRAGKFAERSIDNTEESLKAATHLLLDIIVDYHQRSAQGYSAATLLGATQPALTTDPSPLKHTKTSSTKGPAVGHSLVKRQRTSKQIVSRPIFPGFAAGDAVGRSAASRPRRARPTSIVVLRISPERLRLSDFAGSANRSDEQHDVVMQGATAVQDGTENAMATDVAAIDGKLFENAPSVVQDFTSAKPESTLPLLDLSMLRPNFTGPFAVSDNVLLSWLRSDRMLNLLLEWKRACFDDQAANESFARAILSSGWETTAASIAECACAFETTRA